MVSSDAEQCSLEYRISAIMINVLDIIQIISHYRAHRNKSSTVCSYILFMYFRYDIIRILITVTVINKNVTWTWRWRYFINCKCR